MKARAVNLGWNAVGATREFALDLIDPKKSAGKKILTLGTMMFLDAYTNDASYVGMTISYLNLAVGALAAANGADQVFNKGGITNTVVGFFRPAPKKNDDSVDPNAKKDVVAEQAPKPAPK